jgi:NO-binding membrane sensor protein with MHYT domain
MANLVHSHFHGEYVALSFGFGFVGAYVGVHLSEQLRLYHKSNNAKTISRNMYPVILLMACSIGGVAIWAMHFVGMSAVSFSDPDGNPIDLRYRYDFTLISLVAVVIMCFSGIYVCANDEAYTIDKHDTVEAFVVNTERLSIREIRKQKVTATQVMIKALTKNIITIILGGVITGAGVCVMHYLGMEAVVIDADIHWDAGIVAASVIIAVVASTAAFWIIFRFLALYPHIEAFRFASALIAAIAVNGMHYTGMAAASYEYNPGKAAHNPLSASVDSTSAVLGAVIVSVLLMIVILVYVIVDVRRWFYKSAKVNRTADTLMKMLEREQVGLPSVDRILKKVRGGVLKGYLRAYLQAPRHCAVVLPCQYQQNLAHPLPSSPILSHPLPPSPTHPHPLRSLPVLQAPRRRHRRWHHPRPHGQLRPAPIQPQIQPSQQLQQTEQQLQRGDRQFRAPGDRHWEQFPDQYGRSGPGRQLSQQYGGVRCRRAGHRV